ncbi:MAG: DUF87 domain-containing protein [Pseudomonadota bacterium]
MPTRTMLGLAHNRQNAPAPFGIADRDRLAHLYVIGQTGTGKSTLLAQMARQDGARGAGLCLIDPHGDLAETLHATLPQTHLYWDIADPACRLGYNPLQRVSPARRPLVASGLIDTLKKQWPEAWGARMEHLLRHAILALLEEQRADLRDIMQLFVFKGFRRQVTERLTDPQVRSFWKHEFPALNYQTTADGISPIANKLGAFLAHPTVRTALCEPAEPLRFRRIMDERQILLVNLAKGRLGADVSNVVGGVITASLMHAAFSRHDIPPDERQPFFLYVDEFHNLTTRAFAGLMSEARKYGLGLTLAHQHLAQTETEVRDAILGNVGAMLVFRLGPSDAPFFERFLPPFTARDLMNQPNYWMAVRMAEAGTRLKPFSATTYSPDQNAA